ncbi:MAG TPA: DNA mismatch repair protein MutS [Candidatus Atribacteria bacterium]|nr:DNA mismatch repair protein MutS [Candidatus Atribacteria bacterium]
MAELTPMMQQYFQIKEQYKDAILFYRVGDFYEMFFDDAITASKDLEITLTGKDCGLQERAPMCGVPYHAAEHYIAKLIEKGHKVAICEQVQDPAEAKGLVEREVIRVVTPGTVIESSMLDEKTNNFLVSMFRDDDTIGLAGVDISTGEFFISEITEGNAVSRIYDELNRIRPSEILINEGIQIDTDLMNTIKDIETVYITVYHEWAYQWSNAYSKLLGHFRVQSLEGYGCHQMKYGICAAGALLEYLAETQKTALTQITSIKSYYPQSYMVLDHTARRNLEITETIRGKDKKGSFLWLLDKTNTAMGGRLIKQWIQQPLIDPIAIDERLDCITELLDKQVLMDELKDELRKVYDLERLISRVSYGSANARDMLSLKQSLLPLPKIKEILGGFNSKLFKTFHECFDCLEDIAGLLEVSIHDNPPVSVKEGGIIKAGYNQDLDEYRRAMAEGKSWIASLEQQERDRTGIKNLKIGFNKVFGYYIDITRSNLDLVPDTYIRKQTLANSERYITPELKEIEDKILGAEERSIKLEYELFVEIRNLVASHVVRIQNTARIIAVLDVLYSFAKVSYDNDYVRPTVNDSNDLVIEDGRHPVIEKTLSSGMFVPNSTQLSAGKDHLMIITGPNMAGKSTYMRQVAIIVLMAQIGCYVPAKRAVIGIADRIFTRVGASDDLSSGQSTFMVEMSEVANILNNATRKSLLILDEIGRGTSTYDGLSLAWAVIEHICSDNRLKPRTLFATHYHELTELEGRIEGIKNYCIAVKEHGDDIIFLRKIIRGGADKSFGLHVAKLAGVPVEVINRARHILAQLEEADINRRSESAASKHPAEAAVAEQLSFFDKGLTAIEKELSQIDVLNITPIQAISILQDLVQKARAKEGKGCPT